MKIKAYEKNIGNELNVDELGRIVIPIAMRRKYGIVLRGKVEFEPKADGLLIKTLTASCAICHSIDEDTLVDIGGRYICRQCVQLIMQKAG